MATSQSPIEFNDAHRHLHNLVTSQKLDIDLGKDKEIFAVGVLKHGTDPLTCRYNDLIFFKVKAKHSVAKLRDAYEKRTECKAAFRYNGDVITDTTQMRSLNHMKDNLIIFTAHNELVESPLAPSAVPPNLSVSRTPLQPVKSQLSIALNHPHAVDVKSLIKAESQVTIPDNENPVRYPIVTSSSCPVLPAVDTVTLPQTIIAGNECQSDQLFGLQAVKLSGNYTTPYIMGNSLSGQSPDLGQPSRANSVNTPVNAEVNKQEPVFEDGAREAVSTTKQPSRNDRLAQLIQEASALQLEAEVKSSQEFLENLKIPMMAVASTHKDASHWIQQIENLQKQNVETPTIIGVVGNTGAGKSSVINAMLEEERLVPVNCMRACTAVVTEMSWNSCKEPSKRYRAQIEFIKPEEWRKDIEISLMELVDGSGQLSRDCTNPESEAGVAYAKLKAVYPQKTREMLANATADQLMREPEVKNVLGQIKHIAKGDSGLFYKALQFYIDSNEKPTADGSKKKMKEKNEKKQMEFWPLIKVVKIFVKADALSTGAVIVDLPGVHDSNAARAAVAAGYMKKCTGLFIVAPINRAVDDKAAKSLLGESFKRQLKFDGTYSRITFICSKTDDISVMEASTSLGLDEEVSEDWDRVDELEKKERELKHSIEVLSQSRVVYTELINDAEEALEVWDKIKEDLEDGNEVFAPANSKKRKWSASPKNSRKKSKTSRFHSDSYDDEEENEQEMNDFENDDSDSETSGNKGEPLTMMVIEAKIGQLKADKKRARREKSEIDNKLGAIKQELGASEKSRLEIETAIRAVCIEGRNKYSKGAIQRDFADGIRELDQEAAQEENPDEFNPDEDMRDYEEVARSLPVFCVSSRAYQKLRDRFVRDAKVHGYRTAEDTEIPQLQAHCKKLTERGRASNCRSFLTELSQLLNSLTLWASNDGTGINMTDAQLAAETRFLKSRLKTLEKSLENAVKDCLKEMNNALAEHIFENYEHLVDSAIQKANATVDKWHRPYRGYNSADGGYHFSTYKAIMRRNGVYNNARGEHDFNRNLIEPIIINLAGHWEKVFAQKLPRVLTAFTRDSKILLTAFHKDIEGRCIKNGTGDAGIGLLSLQLKTYDGVFSIQAQQLTEVINSLQREANREFTPVIAQALAQAYEASANQHGTGCYVRMKEIMSSHVEENKTDMFTKSCNEVKLRLLAMCTQVEDTMSARADEVFMKMQRDYMEIVAGTKLSDGQMPRWERRMRSDILKVIEERDFSAEKDSQKATEAILAARAALEAPNMTDEEIEEEGEKAKGPEFPGPSNDHDVMDLS